MFIRRFPLLDKAGDQGGAQGGNGGAGSEGSGEDKDKKPEPKTVDWADHQRVLADMHKFKTELTDLKGKDTKAKEDALKESNKWKELFDQRDAEVKEAREKVERSSQVFKDTIRMGKVVESALKAGLRPEARDDLDLLDLEKVLVEETDAGRYLVRGADSFVEGLKKSKPHWFNDGKAPRFNGGGGTNPGKDGEVTADDVAAVEKKYGKNDPRFAKVWEDWAKGGYK